MSKLQGTQSPEPPSIGSWLIFSQQKTRNKTGVPNRMEEETGRKKQAEAWKAALLVSAQNMSIPPLVCQMMCKMFINNRKS